MLLEDQLPGVEGLPLQLLFLHNDVNVDRHAQKHHLPLLAALGPMPNILCHLQQDGVGLFLGCDHEQTALVSLNWKVCVVDSYADWFFERHGSILEHEVCKFPHPLAREWNAGRWAPQQVQPKKVEPGYVGPPPSQRCLALLRIKRLLDATLCILADGQWVLLGNVPEDLAMQDSADVVLHL